MTLENKFPKLKIDKVSTLEFGGVVVASKDWHGENILFVSFNDNDDD